MPPLIKRYVFKTSSVVEKNLCEPEQGFREASEPKMRTNSNPGEVGDVLFCRRPARPHAALDCLKNETDACVDSSSLGDAPLPTFPPFPCSRANESQANVRVSTGFARLHGLF